MIASIPGVTFSIRVDEHLEIALLEPRHAGEIFMVVDAHRDDLRRWLPWVDGTRSPDDYRAFIGASIGRMAEGGGYPACALVEAGRIVGGIGLEVDPGDRKVEIGYWLAPPARGRGIVSRGVEALVRLAFGELGLHRVTIKCATGNRRSCAVAERLGFTREGVEVDAEWVNDHFESIAIYAVTSPR